MDLWTDLLNLWALHTGCKSSQTLNESLGSQNSNLKLGDTNMLLEANLGQSCKKACFAARAQCLSWAKMATVPTQCLQKVRSRSNRCPRNKFHFKEIFPGPGKKKHCLLAGSFCPLTGRQYLFQLPVSFLWLVKAQGFSCCKASGISKSATSWHKHAPYWNRT